MNTQLEAPLTQPAGHVISAIEEAEAGGWNMCVGLWNEFRVSLDYLVRLHQIKWKEGCGLCQWCCAFGGTPDSEKK